MSPTRIRGVAFCAAALLASVIPARASKVDLVSRRDPGSIAPELIGDADSPALSADGRWAAFTSTALNLAAGQSDANNGADVFLLDRQSGTITLVSHSALSPVVTGTRSSDSPSISADGRFVAFESYSGNLMSDQTDSGFYLQVFLYDRNTGAVTLVSHKAGASAAPANGNSSWPRLSKDGSSVAFMSDATDLLAGGSDANGQNDVFVYDVSTGTVSLVSHAGASATTTGAEMSFFPEISADGRYVLFGSQAVDLVSGQTDSASTHDVFLHDRMTGTTVLVSRASGTFTTAANASSFSGSLSDDGAYAVFSSWATNLVAGQTDTASTSDAFLFERSTGSVTLVSHANGAPGTAVGGFGTISGDGAWVAFGSGATNVAPGQTDANGDSDVFLWQRTTGTTTLASHAAGSANTSGAGASYPFQLSSDGRYLFFGSSATNLVSGQTDTNGVADAFLYDRVGGTTALVTHAHGSSAAATAAITAPEAMVLSADGTWAAFTSTAPDLTAAPDPGARDLFLYERASGANLSFTYGETLSRLTPNNFSAISYTGTSQDGRFIGMASQGTDLVPGQIDTDTDLDVFLVDRLAGTTTLVSHAAGSPSTAANGHSGYPAISADGAWLTFDSDATDLIPGIGSPHPFGGNVFLYGRGSGTLTLVSRRASDPSLSGNGPSLSPVISADGRYVAFSSASTDLVTGQVDASNTGDVFLYDRVTGGMSLASHQAGDALRAASSTPSSPPQVIGITPDGRWVLFPSKGTDLVAGQIEGNAGSDLFLYDRVTTSVTLVSRSASSPATTANAETSLNSIPAISPDGRYVAFLSPATNLVSGQVDTNGQDDLFLFDRLSGTAKLISRQSGTLATAGNDRTLLPLFSEDGLYLTFASLSTNLVPGQWGARRIDPFLYELSTGTLSLLPAGATIQEFGSTYPLGATAGARTILLYSSATDMISSQVDVNGTEPDLFLLERATGVRRLVSRTAHLATGNNGASFALLRGGGNLVVFSSAASDLVPGDFNTKSDVFIYTAGAAPAADYYTVTPCRSMDTRAGSPLFSGTPLHTSLGEVCGVPPTAVAVAVNVTVTAATGSGDLKLYPADVDPPTATAISFQAGATRANNAVLPLSNDDPGGLKLLATVTGGGTVDAILDVVGYFQ